MYYEDIYGDYPLVPRGDAGFWAIISAQGLDWIESCQWDSIAFDATFMAIYG